MHPAALLVRVAPRDVPAAQERRVCCGDAVHHGWAAHPACAPLARAREPQPAHRRGGQRRGEARGAAREAAGASRAHAARCAHPLLRLAARPPLHEQPRVFAVGDSSLGGTCRRRRAWAGAARGVRTRRPGHALALLRACNGRGQLHLQHVPPPVLDLHVLGLVLQVPRGDGVARRRAHAELPDDLRIVCLAPAIFLLPVNVVHRRAAAARRARPGTVLH
mmetsp:Transcript_1460/g.3748  ORF Transcript_1460/g.3748 Transcript_1460/m.3748 type:complete len:220 (-) Transcript_1460:421-1080(-)